MNEDRIVDVFLVCAFIAVIVLKCTGVITLSWLWLLSPIWIALGFGLLIAIVMLIVILVKFKGDFKE